MLQEVYSPDQIRCVTLPDLLSKSAIYFKQYPCMLGTDVRELECLLSKLANSSQQQIDILEWGLGGSTVYFTKFLSQFSRQWSWLAIEHDAAWHSRIAPTLTANTSVWLYDKYGSDPRHDKLDMSDYTDAPLRADPARKFDLIIIDGRCRRRCLLTAARSLKPSGVCLLHDAARTYYHSSFAAFKHHSMLHGTMWWRGQQEHDRR